MNEGCDSGFGNALAARLDHLGFKVYAGCLDVNSRGVQDLKAKTSDRMQLVSLDVTCQKQVDEAYQLVTATLDSYSKTHLKLLIQLEFIHSREIRRVHRVLGGHQQRRDRLVIGDGMVSD